MVSLEDVVESLKDYLVDHEFARDRRKVVAKISKSSFLGWNVKFSYNNTAGTQCVLDVKVKKPIRAFFGRPWRAYLSLNERNIVLDLSKKYEKSRSWLSFFAGNGLHRLYDLIPASRTQVWLSFLMGMEAALIETGLAKNMFTNVDAAGATAGTGVVVAITSTVLFPPGRYLGESLGMNYVENNIAVHDPVNKVKAIKDKKLGFLDSGPWMAHADLEDHLRAGYYTADSESNIFEMYAKHSGEIKGIIASNRPSGEKAAAILNLLFENNPPRRYGPKADPQLYEKTGRLVPLDSEKIVGRVRALVLALRNNHLVQKDDNLEEIVNMTKSVIERGWCDEHDTGFNAYEDTLDDEIAGEVRSLHRNEMDAIKDTSLHTLRNASRASLLSTAALGVMYYLSTLPSISSLGPLYWGAAVGGKTMFDGTIGGFYQRVRHTFELYVYRKLLELSPASADQTMIEYQSMYNRMYDLGYIVGVTGGLALTYTSIAFELDVLKHVHNIVAGVSGILTYSVFRRFYRQAMGQQFDRISEPPR